MKVFIVDDESDSRKIISMFLNDRFPDVSISGEADNIEDAVQFLNTNQIDLLFLDIQLKEGTGFQILESLDQADFDVIFITAYDQYAIKAIRANALDYILKPIIREEFNQAVEKAMDKNTSIKLSKIDALMQSFEKVLSPIKLNLPTQHGFKIVPLNEITRCEADSSYTMFHLTNGSSILVSKTMKEYENTLLDNSFVRIHNSHIVNIHSIQEYIKGRGGEVILTNGKRLAVSNGRKDDLFRALKLKK